MSAKWRKLWIEERGSFAQLPLRARSLFRELLILANDEGVIDCGQREPWQAVCWALGADRSDRRLVREVLPMLLEDGCLAVLDGDLVFPGWARFQADGQPPSSRRGRASKQPTPRSEPTTIEQRTDHDRAPTEHRTNHDGAPTEPRSSNESRANTSKSHTRKRQDKEEEEEEERESATHSQRARGRPSSSIDCPDPLGEFETVSSEELPWRAWLAVGRRRGIVPTNADRRRDLHHVQDLERRVLELAPQVAEARGIELGVAAKLIVLTAMNRFGEDFDAERAPNAFGRPKLEWRLGFAVVRWAELTQGLIPKAGVAAPSTAVGVPSTLPVWRAWVRASHGRGFAPSDRDRLEASPDLATLDRRIREHAAPIAAARGVTVDVVADELARDLVEGFLVAFQAERTSDAKEPPRLEWAPRSLLAALPALLPQTQADTASRPKAAQTAA